MMPRIRIGLVGGGPGAFIGPVHALAARLDGEFELVAGAFSRDASRQREAAGRYRVSFDRSYESWPTLLRAERQRPDGIEALVIATPNDSHLPIALAALEAELHVFSDKPAARSVAEAVTLRRAVEASARVYGLAYVYSGYPLMREVRALCQAGRFGRLRRVDVEYLQGWMSRPVERTGNRQAEWRTDPAQAGTGGCLGDIGVHAFHLLEFVTDRAVTAVQADVATVVEERRVDDDFRALLRLQDDARGSIAASQVATGAGNGLRLRLYGDLGGCEWDQETPDRLILLWPDRPAETLRAGTDVPGLSAGVRALCRLPAGHPEGFIEAFANLYREFAAEIRLRGSAPQLPGIRDGLRGLRFVEAALESARGESAWIEMP